MLKETQLGKEVDMIELEVNSGHSRFVEGKLVLQTVYVSYSYDGVSKGAINVTRIDGLTNTSTEEDVKRMALVKIEKEITTLGDNNG